VEGARALWVTFDPRCQLGNGAVLSFFSDRAQRTPVMQCSGGARSFRAFVVHGDTVFTQFRSSNQPGLSGWGYRFFVAPMEGLQWLSEPQVCALALTPPTPLTHAPLAQRHTVLY
jgi:hypothetical protein